MNGDDFDRHLGEDGRGPENPPYNIEQVLNSAANEAIQKLPKQNPINATFIKDIRSKLNIERFNKTINDGAPFKCEQWCLFDLFEDLCETTNLIDKEPLIAQELKVKLGQYYEELVPQKPHVVDRDSNPAYCNNTWFTWLDFNQIVVPV